MDNNLGPKSANAVINRLEVCSKCGAVAECAVLSRFSIYGYYPQISCLDTEACAVRVEQNVVAATAIVNPCKLIDLPYRNEWERLADVLEQEKPKRKRK